MTIRTTHEDKSDTDLPEILRDLPEEKAVRIGDVAGQMGGHGHALVILLLSIPEIIPFVPSVAVVLGIPILLLSIDMALHGEARRLPDWLSRRTIPQSIISILRDRGAPFLDRIGWLIRPRWEGLARRTRLVGAFCVAMSLILLVPIPFLNTPPALCLILMTLGLILRDGMLVMLGLALTLVVGAGMAMIASTGLGWLSDLF